MNLCIYFAMDRYEMESLRVVREGGREGGSERANENVACCMPYAQPNDGLDSNLEECLPACER